MKYSRTIAGVERRNNGDDKTLRNRWKHMIERCSNPKRKDYKYYGGKGITVCESWHKFIEFYAWFDAALWEYCETRKDTVCVSKLVIDRINSSIGYEPDNCRLITVAENARRAIYGRDANGRFSVVKERSAI